MVCPVDVAADIHISCIRFSDAGNFNLRCDATDQWPSVRKLKECCFAAAADMRPRIMHDKTKDQTKDETQLKVLLLGAKFRV